MPHVDPRPLADPVSGGRPPARMLLVLTALLAVLATSLSLAPRADAARPYALGGKRWPGHTITYYDAFKDAAHRWAVSQAVQAWNRSGAKIRFAAVSRKRAQVIVQPLKARAEAGYTAGLGTLGYPGPRRKAGVWLTRDRTDIDQFEMAEAAAHEFGHILGLNHVSGCALMAPEGLAQCPPLSDDSLWPCRLIQPRDLAGVIRRYGGRSRLSATPATCAKGPRPAPVTGLTAQRTGPGTFALSWTNPPAPATQYVASWNQFDCPATPDAGHTVIKPITGGVENTTFRAPTTGSYCVVVWAESQVGVRSAAPATVTVDVTDPRVGFNHPEPNAGIGT